MVFLYSFFVVQWFWKSQANLDGVRKNRIIEHCPPLVSLVWQYTILNEDYLGLAYVNSSENMNTVTVFQFKPVKKYQVDFVVTSWSMMDLLWSLILPWKE